MWGVHEVQHIRKQFDVSICTDMSKRPIRFYIEITGLLLLIVGVWTQRGLIPPAVDAIKSASLPLVIACLALQWLAFFWTALGYYVLTKRSIKISDAYLTNLAAAGAGRVVPAGAGQLSFGVLFLTKQKFSTTKALAIALTNNVMGFVVNSIFVFVILLFVAQPTARGNKGGIYFIILSIMAIVIALCIKPLRTKLLNLLKTMGKTLNSPGRTAQIVAIATATLLTNSVILALAASSVGLHISIAQAIIIMSSGVAVGSVVPTPGGIGGVEAGLIAAFVAFGFDSTLAASATAIFRLATYVQPLLPGVWAYVYLRRRKKL